MVECIFCNIVNNKIPSIKIYENDNFLAFLNIHPLNPGDTLVVPKEHYENIFEIKQGEFLLEYFDFIDKIIVALKKVYKTDIVNINMNRGSSGSKIIGHCHIHVIPRFENDSLMVLDSENKVSYEELEKVAEKIKKEL